MIKITEKIESLLEGSSDEQKKIILKNAEQCLQDENWIRMACRDFNVDEENVLALENLAVEFLTVFLREYEEKNS
jgi:hypothetical protein